MRHIHLEACESTQDFILQELRKELQNNKFTGPHKLVSTDMQTHGHGRRGQSWMHLNSSLAFSFSVELNHNNPTLIPLEIGVLLAEFLNPLIEKGKILLKWPNDLITDERKKVGGIIIQTLSQKIAAVGIGINLQINNQEINSYIDQNFKFPLGLLTLKKIPTNHKKELPHMFYDYFLKNRMNFDQTRERFIKNCAHLNLEVKIDNGSQQLSGVFTGIGPQGEALIKIEEKENIPVFSGGLFF